MNEAAMTAPMPGLGRSLRRLEDQRLLTGAGRFAENVAAGKAGAAHVVFVRSPHAKAHADKIELAEALDMPGVLAIYTAAEADADGLGHMPAAVEIKGTDGQRHREPKRLPMSNRLRYVGDIVAMVAAETVEQARDAATYVHVSYDDQPAVVTADDALGPDAPLVHEDVPGNLMCDWEHGDAAGTDAAFVAAAHVTHVQHRFNRIVAGYLETRSGLAEWDHAAERVTLTTPSQGVHVVHRLLCDSVLHWPRESLRVVTQDVGGGFGPKFNLYPEQALLAWACRKLERDLRWMCERTESFVADAHARDLVAEAELALDGDGRFLGLRVRAAANFGAYVSLHAPTIPTTGLAKVISGLYRIPAIHIAMKCAFSNTVPVDAFRGAGKPEGLLLLEELVDKAAAETGRDPLALRQLNLLRPADLPYATPAGYRYDSGDYPRLLDEAINLADAAGFAARRQANEARGLRRGLGVACHLHGTGGVADEHSALIVHADGVVEARTGTQSQGQGHETVYAQLVAARLGIAPDQIRLVQGDTAAVTRGGGTGGSSSTIISGTTLVRAADVLILRGRELAADELEAAIGDIAYRDGAFEVVGTDRRIGLFDLAARAGKRGKSLDGDAAFADKIESWPTGVMVCEVEVDPETGAVRIDRFTSTADLGLILNPMLCDGQMHGGIAQGIGNALLEDGRYDRQSGQLLAGSLMDYTLPRADDVPSFAHHSIAIPSPNNMLGLKGVGELPNNGALAAVVNAVLDALRPLGVTGIDDLPLTPLRVWQAIDGAAPTRHS
jgi:carbon-monoxide dehydrogenase large subunit